MQYKLVYLISAAISYLNMAADNCAPIALATHIIVYIVFLNLRVMPRQLFVMIAILGRKWWDARIWAIIEVATQKCASRTSVKPCLDAIICCTAGDKRSILHTKGVLWKCFSKGVSSGCAEPPSSVTPVSCRRPGGSANPWKESSALPDDILRGALQLR